VSEMVKRIGLIGYFGAEAYSDDLIEDVTKQLLLEQRSDLVFDSTLLSKGQASCNIDYLNSFDLLIHCGGSLLGKCTHYPIRDIEQWVDKVHTPLAVFGIGYRFEPDKEPLTPEMHRRVTALFDKSEVICVRGYKTIQHLEENHLDTGKICCVADPVTAHPVHPHGMGRVLVGNVRCMPDVEIQHNSTEKVYRLLAQCYDWLIDVYKLPLRLVSWRHNIDYDNDLTGANQVQRMMRYGSQVTIHTPANYREAANMIDDAVFYFGQRLHPTVYAATQGIPFVGVEYQFDKMLDWASTVGIDNVVHTGTDTLVEFIEAYSRVQENMTRLKETIPLKARELRLTAKRIVDLI